MGYLDYTYLFGQFVNYDDEKLTGQIHGVGHDGAMVQINWQIGAMWHDEFKRGVKPQDRSEYPAPILRTLPYDQLHLVSKEPKYLVEGLALNPNPCKIQTSPRRQSSQSIPRPQVAKPVAGSPSPLRNGSGSSQEIEIMAKTAVFDSENELVGVYTSGKEAKKHNKGDDLVFVSEKDFPADGIGEHTAESLFPKKEAPVKAEGESKRTVIKRVGEYTVVKADGARFNEGDERAAIHAALVESASVEEFLEKSPKVANFTSSRGAAQSVTASGYMAYAFKRGWLTQGDVVVEEAGE